MAQKGPGEFARGLSVSGRGGESRRPQVFSHHPPKPGGDGDAQQSSLQLPFCLMIWSRAWLAAGGPRASGLRGSMNVWDLPGLTSFSNPPGPTPQGRLCWRPQPLLRRVFQSVLLPLSPR